jgi:pimeloyl-ACP methyl ester carboxylesterase
MAKTRSGTIAGFIALIIALVASDATCQPIAGTPLERREVVDELGRTVTYYNSRPKAAVAPVLLMLQGSGCMRILNTQGNNTFSTLFNLVPFATEGRFSVVAVEKPHAGRTTGSSGTAAECTPEFNDDFTAERWLVALRAALNDARTLPWADKTRTLAFGFSEGAVMAGLLASHDASITDVVSISGSGTTQLFDFIALAYRRCFDTSVCLAEIDRNVQAIQRAPDSSTEMAWGHPHKRWTSFFRIDQGEELLRSKARVYMAFGTADVNVPALSAEVAVAKLRVAGRNPTVRRIPNGTHVLSDNSQGGMRDLDREFRAALDWFWKLKD